MAGFDGIGDIRRGGGQRGGGIDDKAAGRRLFAGKAGGDRREVITQRAIDGFSSANSTASCFAAKREM